MKTRNNDHHFLPLGGRENITEKLRIENDSDINELREKLRSSAKECGFADFETTKLVTAASEISRNIVNYAKEGFLTIGCETDDVVEIRLVFEDSGPGIPDLDRAMEDGFSGEESNGLGVGLPGAERLSDEFEIDSTVGEGTTVTLVIRMN